jgi:hypothetical protein
MLEVNCTPIPAPEQAATSDALPSAPPYTRLPLGPALAVALLTLNRERRKGKRRHA